ncbi:MobQ family relaxase [Pelotalea chapellei]|uniref:MobA/MobL family protein n=1 Tax=Pelotalea chapellei TaxID=44671 RepID=A0ABS5UDA2_9BACT|nr:MobQ family relaxase [Pelotalea chapellei]MBT1073618.1 MobA/MobL family protein [Pelotalea chapellei]
MAIYHQAINIIDRKSGRSAVAAAAYRAGEKIDDERTGEIHDYSRKRGIVHSELILPGGGTEDRATYWNRVEKHHKRGDAILAREVEIAIPAELDERQRQCLASKFNRELADKYSVAADLNIHKPHRAKADTRNHHAHIMLSACYTAEDGTLGKKAVELDPIHCQRNKLENMAEWTRKRWAELANEALRNAGLRERIDHRSLEAQREDALFCAENAKVITNSPTFKAEQIKKAAMLDRPATIHLGPSATAMERRGEPTDRGNYNRRVLAQIGERDTLKDEQIEIEKRLAEINREMQDLLKEIEADLLDQAKQVEAARLAAELEKTRLERQKSVSVSRPIVTEGNGQSEALPTEKKTNLPPQQPAVAVGVIPQPELKAPAPTIADLPAAVLYRLYEISQKIVKLVLHLNNGFVSPEKFNTIIDELELNMKTILKPYPGTKVCLDYEKAIMTINGHDITATVAKLPPEQPQPQPPKSPQQGRKR